MKVVVSQLVLFTAIVLFAACERDNSPEALDPETAETESVDRFSADAGTLMVRDAENALPDANEPVDFDQDPFITKGLGPGGEIVEYYNFDVMPLIPAPIYVLTRQGDSVPVPGQLNIIDQIPGDPGYNDFWQVVHVTVPESYTANTAAGFTDIVKGGYETETSNMIVNCPVVPQGSTATKRYGSSDTELHRGWYKRKVVYYFNFEEAELTTTPEGYLPTSPIYVTFNINPGLPDGGPSSGSVTETGTAQTHNVIATLPGDDGYSPLWSVNIYDNADFDNVADLQTAQAASIITGDATYVNCPVVTVQ